MTARARDPAKLTLGPVLFNWPAAEWRDFHFRIADEALVDVVYLGEVVCSKRAPAIAAYLPEVVDRLRGAGKKVVLSTLALVVGERDMDAVRALAAEPDHLVEANDISAIALLAGRRHVVGPFVNVYNEGTLRSLTHGGAIRVVLSNELSGGALAVLADAADAVELEVQVFGRLPLAISARCYHARVHGLHKDNCQYVCAEDADGMVLDTLDGEPFLAINGTQTMSYTYGNLVGELGDLVAMGINCFRLWPHATDMVAVARTFRDVLDGRDDAEAGRARLAGLANVAPFSNGFYHGHEGAALVGARTI